MSLTTICNEPKRIISTNGRLRLLQMVPVSLTTICNGPKGTISTNGELGLLQMVPVIYQVVCKWMLDELQDLMMVGEKNKIFLIGI